MVAHQLILRWGYPGRMQWTHFGWESLAGKEGSRGKPQESMESNRGILRRKERIKEWFKMVVALQEQQGAALIDHKCWSFSPNSVKDHTYNELSKEEKWLLKVNFLFFFQTSKHLEDKIGTLSADSVGHSSELNCHSQTGNYKVFSLGLTYIILFMSYSNFLRWLLLSLCAKLVEKCSKTWDDLSEFMQTDEFFRFKSVAMPFKHSTFLLGQALVPQMKHSAMKRRHSGMCTWGGAMAARHKVKRSWWWIGWEVMEIGGF